MTHSFISQTLSYTDNGTPLRSCWFYVGGELAAGCDQGRFPSRDSLPNGLEMWEGYRVKGVMHVGLGRRHEGTNEPVCLGRVEGRDCHLWAG